VLHRALTRAAAIELVARNVASLVKPPKVTETEIESLKADEIDAVLMALKDHPLESPVLALSTGARRGEILALNWGNVDLDAGTIKIERSLEQTKAGLRFKAPRRRTDAVWCPCPRLPGMPYARTGGAGWSFGWPLGKASPSQMRSSSVASTTTPFRPTI
jgi:hypothetical protein